MVPLVSKIWTSDKVVSIYYNLSRVITYQHSYYPYLPLLSEPP